MLRDAWESEAENWVRWARAPGHDSYWLFHRDAFLGLLPGPGRLTLDAGCGEGRLTRDLTRHGHRVIGLDPSRTMVRHAALEGGGVGFVRGDAANLPLPGGAADLAVAFMTLQDVDDMPGCIRELARVLEPGGRLCLAIPHPINSVRTVIDHAQRRFWMVEAGAYWATRRMVDSVEQDGLRMTFHGMHRPLQDYFKALSDVGLLTEMVREPQGTGSSSGDFPWFLHLRARKP